MFSFVEVHLEQLQGLEDYQAFSGRENYFEVPIESFCHTDAFHRG